VETHGAATNIAELPTIPGSDFFPKVSILTAPIEKQLKLIISI
jgi:hypothetical protein